MFSTGADLAEMGVVDFALVHDAELVAEGFCVERFCVGDGCCLGGYCCLGEGEGGECDGELHIDCFVGLGG